MRIFLIALCMTSLLFSGVGMARGNVAAQSSGKVAQFLGKVKKGAALTGVGILSLTAVCATITGCGEDDEVAEVVDDGAETAMETFKIGHTYDAGLKGSHEGAQLAVQQINEGGGINGRMVELPSRDNQRNTDVSYATVKDLVEHHEVIAVTGPDYSTQAAAINDYMQASKTPLVTAGATNPNVSAAGDYIFMASFPDSFQGLVMANLAVDEYDARTAAVFYLDGDVYSKGWPKHSPKALLL